MTIPQNSDVLLNVHKAAKPKTLMTLFTAAAKRSAATKPADFTAMVVNPKAAGIGKFLSTDIVAEVASLGPGNAETRMASLIQPDGAQDIPPPAAATVASAAKAKVYQQFEGSMLRNFVEEMLPKDAAASYGQGLAGNTWRSMQADFVSAEIAKSGGIGIARMLAKADHVKSNTLNQIMPAGQGQHPTISNASEWPYFKLSGLAEGQKA
jgi:hypothetical protein